MSIKEKLASRPAIGTVVNKEIKGLGTVGIKVLSFKESLKIESTFDSIAASVLEEDGTPVFESGAEVEALDMVVGNAILDAVTSVNRLDVDGAAKK